MGYRSTLVGQYYDGELPEWFKKKYSTWISFPRGLMVSSKCEDKYNDNEFFEDYQKAIAESGFWDRCSFGIMVAVLSEDGFVTKVWIKKDEINYYWTMETEDGYRVWDV